MRFLSHATSRLSISLGAALTLLGLASADIAVAAAPAASPYFGRWTVEDREAPFSSRGIEYKSVDIAPCGNDFCGVSVSPQGRCGATLFRFLSRNRNAEMLKGHGKWGSQRKNVVIYTFEGETPGSTMLQLFLGDGYNLGGREGNAQI